jgi:hypothetical protein
MSVMMKTIAPGLILAMAFSLSETVIHGQVFPPEDNYTEEIPDILIEEGAPEIVKFFGASG